jgi:hypothetical protein
VSLPPYLMFRLPSTERQTSVRRTMLAFGVPAPPIESDPRLPPRHPSQGNPGTTQCQRAQRRHGHAPAPGETLTAGAGRAIRTLTVGTLRSNPAQTTRRLTASLSGAAVVVSGARAGARPLWRWAPSTAQRRAARVRTWCPARCVVWPAPLPAAPAYALRKAGRG